MGFIAGKGLGRGLGTENKMVYKTSDITRILGVKRETLAGWKRRKEIDIKSLESILEKVIEKRILPVVRRLSRDGNISIHRLESIVRKHFEEKNDE